MIDVTDKNKWPLEICVPIPTKKCGFFSLVLSCLTLRNMKQKESDCFKIHFEGHVDQIDVNVLVNNLLHTSTIIQEANKFLDTGKKIEVMIRPFEKGSFIVNVELIATVADELKSLFTKENIQVAANVVVVFSGLLTLKSFLGGKRPKSIEKKDKNTTIITNQNDNKTIVDNRVYNFFVSSPEANDAVSKAFEAINNEPGITAYEIQGRKGEQLARIEKPDFAAMTEDLLPDDKNDRRVEESSAILTIIGLSFDESQRWEFSYKGRRINAKIKDPNFYERIDKGQPFAKGDMLEVNLKIKQVWDSSLNVYMDKSYQVDKITQHIPRGYQESLDL